ISARANECAAAAIERSGNSDPRSFRISTPGSSATLGQTLRCRRECVSGAADRVGASAPGAALGCHAALGMRLAGRHARAAHADLPRGSTVAVVNTMPARRPGGLAKAARADGARAAIGAGGARWLARSVATPTVGSALVVELADRWLDGVHLASPRDAAV